MNIAIIYSPNWKEYIATEIYAIFKNNPSPINVYLVSDLDGYIDLSYLKSQFGDGYEISFIAADNLYHQKIITNTNVSFRYTKYALYRLLLPELINEDKLIYLDADTIVNGDISEFYNMELGDNLIVGVVDIGAYTPTYDLKTPIGLKPDDIYVNAGVLLMNLKRIREEKVHEQWIYEANNNHYACHDQCIINKTCRDRIITVENKYNVSLSTGLEIDEKDIKIIHYAGLLKGWSSEKVRHHKIWDKWDQENKEICLKKQRIPKVINYSWFGDKPKPLAVLECIESWRKYLPDCEIKEWNETNFDININNFVREAYESKKYAFVNDYLRLWTLWNYGGIYMDSDVEILKNLDKFLCHRAFTGHETDELMVTAITGAEAKHEWIKMLLDYYEDKNFDMTPNTQIITKMSQEWVERHEGGFRYLKGDVVIYPKDVFAPYDHVNLKSIPTENSYAIHHFLGTWINRTII